MLYLTVPTVVMRVSLHYSLWGAAQVNSTYSGEAILLWIPLEPQKVCFYWYFLTPEPAVHPQRCRRVFPLSMYPFPIHLRLQTKEKHKLSRLFSPSLFLVPAERMEFFE